MALRFVQSVLRGDVTPEESAGWAPSEESGKNRTRLCAWPLAAECVNVRTGNPAVVGTYVP